MGDFHQSGVITTLHNLTRRPVEELEAELSRFSNQRALGLILPSLYSELEGPALGHIVNELKSVDYLHRIVIGLDRADQDEFQKAGSFFSSLGDRHQILWNDGPRLRALDAELQALGLAPSEPGKGRNAWYCLGYMLACGDVDALALHDCDIVTYERGLLARLIYPVANPAFSYEFCKGFYARVADGKLNGRVSRLLVTPLLHALKKCRGGESEYLDYLDSFRYPLAGEFSMRIGVVPDLKIPADWGLEVGILSEMYRNYSTNRICQVDIADIYDHKHQQLSTDNDQGGLSKMSIDISKAIFRKLATKGWVFQQETFRSLKATYYRLALDLVEAYKNDAAINGLSVDVHREEQAVELFAANIMKAGHHFLENPLETPFIPSWNRVASAKPDVFEQLKAAVEADRAEFL